MIEPTLEKKLLAHIIKNTPTECWNWMGNKSSQIQYNKKRYEIVRLIYELENQNPLSPDEMLVRTCNEENLLCVNPAHRKIIRTNYTINSYAFTNEDDVSFYLLGAYMTDGCMLCNKYSYKIQLTSKDEDWLLSIRDMVVPKKPLHPPSNNRSVYDLRFTDQQSYMWLMKYGCVPRKSTTLKVSHDIPKQYIPDFIRGCIDGDGSISIFNDRKGQRHISITLCSASEVFISQVKQMIPINIRCHQYKLKRENKSGRTLNGYIINHNADYHFLRLNGFQAVEFLKWIYYPHHKLSLIRKRIIADKASNIKRKFRSTITDKDIPIIRKMIADGIRHSKIAKQFSVCSHAISDIKLRKSWKHIL